MRITQQSKKIEFITRAQFGYLIDYKYVSEIAKSQGINVGYTCLETNPRIKNHDILVRYAKARNKFIRYLKLVLLVYRCDYRDSSVMVGYFPFCSLLLPFINSSNITLDVRTASVSKKRLIRKVYNSLLAFESRFFNRITVISNRVGEFLGLSGYTILELGAQRIVGFEAEKTGLDLIYIGTFHNRRIEDTIEGFNLCKGLLPHDVRYHIVGDGPAEQLKSMYETVRNYGLSDRVIFHGRLEHSELGPLLSTCSIGVSYVPKTTYFNNQPPTKTLEYIANGLICVATSTAANQDIVTSDFGILHEDNPHAFAEAICHVFSNKSSFSENSAQKIKTWLEIANNYIDTLLK